MSVMKKFLGFAALLVFVLGVSGMSVAAEQKVHVLRLTTVVNAPHPWHDAANYLAKELDARTNGAVQVKIFGSGQLGTDQATFEEARMGTIDLIIGGATTLVNFIPELGILNLPYFYSDIDQFRKVMSPRSPVVNRFREIYEEKQFGVRLLTLGGGGTRVFSNNLKVIIRPDDLKGMKMRVPNNPEDAKIWSSIGALVTAMPWNEIYSALQAGVVNAFESTISSYYGSKFYEVAKNMSNTQHIIMVSHLLISESTWQKLPEEYRKILDELSDEVSRIFTDNGEEADKQLIQELQEKYGVTVSEVDKAAFVESFQSLHDELAEKGNNQALLQLLRDTKAAAK
ncbi:MAG: TRAP transporter substrate-binding protein [Synergistaceae bacterium]|jgi:tripartite ATP-independent transporter DctP family solute receptor|nr:TRAP transporter substrate-binding protein [Synergistaceae bacterium]